MPLNFSWNEKEKETNTNQPGLPREKQKMQIENIFTKKVEFQNWVVSTLRSECF